MERRDGRETLALVAELQASIANRSHIAMVVAEERIIR